LNRVTGFVAVASLLTVVGGCTATRWDGSAARQVVPIGEELPRSKSGNPPFYEVYGVRYKVMDSSAGYKERGVASWYGKKFHGRATSSGERYNMYEMTAAHKSLPLPTIARVTNLNNGKSVVVRVNDRGPFVKNRIIDMSYAAALELEMTGAGTALVEVEALTGKANAGGQGSRTAARSRMYMQVGAFGESGNARDLARRLNANGIPNVQVKQSTGEYPALYRVRIGPVSSVTEYDRIAQQVERLQISETHLVVENY
jgi:rare lipoprotein A